MSKKLAAGADIIVLDVKTGSGAFMKNEEDAQVLAEQMVNIGNLAGKKTAAVITDMDEPLGFMIGNALEVKEAISVLHGENCGHLLELCLKLGSCALQLAGICKNESDANELLLKHINDGSALEKLAELVEAQGGDRNDVYDISRLPMSSVQYEVRSKQAGYISYMKADDIGLVSMHLGGGREKKDDVIDLSVGIELKAKTGDYINLNDILAIIHSKSIEDAQNAEKELLSCYSFSQVPIVANTFIKRTII